MREQNYVHRAIVSPAGIFKCPMEVVEADGIQLLEKVAILKAWEADERALLRAEDEGMSGGEHAHLHKGWRLWSISRIWASRRSLQQNLTNFT